jgi:hypothetical protein
LYKEKHIGKRKSFDECVMPSPIIASESDKWLKTVQSLRCAKKVCRKGIYKFKTFEEADQWMEAMILRNSQEFRERTIPTLSRDIRMLFL